MQITVTASQTSLPEKSGRKQLVCKNTGTKTAYWGWEAETSAAAGATQGVPLAAGADLAFAGRELDLGAQLFFVCATGETTTINFTQKA